MNTQALEALEQEMRKMTHRAAFVEGSIVIEWADQLKAIREPTELETSIHLIRQALKEANVKLAACEALLSSWDEYNAKHLKAVRQPYTLPVREPAAQLRAALRGEA